jgi:hypothetical protein
LNELGITHAELPAPVQQQCRALLRRLGLVFGCIDLIVTPTGEHVFLEINQMGQFLWVEEMCPQIPLLQMFCEFLARPDARGEPAAAQCRYPFADVRADAVQMLSDESGRHRQTSRPAHIVQE